MSDKERASHQVRLITRAGVPTVERRGLPRRPLGDLYHGLMRAHWGTLAVLVVGGYLVANVLFALLYLACGDGIVNARPGNFTDAFFFSVQTMATIGYGQLAPATFAAHVIVTVEALVGLIGFAVTTGLLFAKFSKPTARVLFSKVAVITRWNGNPCLMFRMANERSNQIVEAQLRVVMARNETTVEGQALRRFYDLELQRKQNAIFALTWTAIHLIDDKSPLHGATPESLRAVETELIASLVGIDETFSQTVHARWSYVADELEWNARFVDILSRLPDGRRMIDYHRFHDTTPVEDPAHKLDKV